MPIMQCTKDGKSGYKYGESGHCYTGPGAKKKAQKQGQAIEISRHTAKSYSYQALQNLGKEDDNDS